MFQWKRMKNQKKNIQYLYIIYNTQQALRQICPMYRNYSLMQWQAGFTLQNHLEQAWSEQCISLTLYKLDLTQQCW